MKFFIRPVGAQAIHFIKIFSFYELHRVKRKDGIAFAVSLRMHHRCSTDKNNGGVRAVVPQPSVNTGHFRVPSVAGCCGVFFAPTVLWVGNTTMMLRWIPPALSGASRQGGPHLWANVALIYGPALCFSLAWRLCWDIIFS